MLFHVNNNRDPNMCIDAKGNVGIGKMPEVDCALDVAKVTRTDVLRIGDKWRLSGVGDGHGNDGWLRLFDAAGNGYRGGMAMDILWTGSHAYLNGNTRSQRHPLGERRPLCRRRYLSEGVCPTGIHRERCQRIRSRASRHRSFDVSEIRPRKSVSG